MTATPAASSHPDTERLRAFALGHLPPHDIAAVADHVGGCAHCRQLVDSQLTDWNLGVIQKADREPGPATDMPCSAGQKIKHYRILEKRGQGGMGVVFLAYDENLHRPVALKFPLIKLKQRPAFRERFLREARIMARVGKGHPAFVQVFEVDEVDGHLYLAMEFLHGENLEERLKRTSTLSVAESTHVASEIALALHHAHAQGVVHRDIKPSNIWLETTDAESSARALSPPGTPPAGDVSTVSEFRVAPPLSSPAAEKSSSSMPKVKLLDFGLARPVDTDQELTGADTVLGTPGYMAPEQARGLPPAAAADLFSLGVVCYRMLTGVSPFLRATASASLAAVLEETPQRPAELNKTVPSELCSLVMRLLSKKEDGRPAHAGEVAQALARIPRGVPSRGARRERSSISLLAGAGVLTALILAVVGYLIFRGRDLQPDDGVTGFLSSPNPVVIPDRGPPSKPADKTAVPKTLPKVEPPPVSGSAIVREPFAEFAVSRWTTLLKWTSDGKLHALSPDYLLQSFDVGAKMPTSTEKLPKRDHHELSTDGKLLFHWSPRDGRAEAIHRDSGKVIWKGPTPRVLRSVSERGFFIAGFRFARLMELDGTDNAETIHEGNVEGVTAMHFLQHIYAAPDFSAFLMGEHDGDVYYFNPANKARSKYFRSGRTDFFPYALAAFPDCQRFVLAGRKPGVIALFDVKSDTAVREFIGHAGPVDALLVDADRDRLFSAGADATVREWNLKTGVEVRRFERHQKDVTLLALSPDGQFIASGGQDDFVCVWRVAGGK